MSADTQIYSLGMTTSGCGGSSSANPNIWQWWHRDRGGPEPLAMGGGGSDGWEVAGGAAGYVSGSLRLLCPGGI